MTIPILHYHAIIARATKWAEWIEEGGLACAIRLEDEWWEHDRNLFGQVSPYTRQQAMYIAMRLDGVSHNLAEMLALRQPPQSNTDREFLKGKCNGNQFEGVVGGKMGDYYRQVAESLGQNVTGKVYLSSLAAFPGDPEAWVSGKGDIERVLDKRGWGCEGLVKREVRTVAEPEPGPAVAPHLIENEVAGICRHLGDDGSIDRVDLAEQVFNRRKGPSEEAFEPAKHCPAIVESEGE